jgi:hypothetical protein
MLTKFVTVIDVFTKYTVPVSELWTTAFPPKTTLPVVAVTVGAAVSILTVTAVEADEELPAASVATAVITLSPPALRVPVVHEKAPLPFTVQVLPVATPPTYN